MIANDNDSKISEEREFRNKANCYIEEIHHKIYEKFSNKYDLGLTAIGDLKTNGIFDNIGIAFFTVNRTISKQKARQILVECVQDYIQAVNKDKRLRPHLKVYPITEKNIDVGLLIYDSEEELERLYFNRSANALLGYVEYKTYDVKNLTEKTIQKETFKEAVKKVKEGNPKEDLF
jgi:uncharacterized membrane protein